MESNKDTRIYYTIRHVQKIAEDKYQELVNHYKTMDEVMERFDYWSGKSEGEAPQMLVQVIVTVATAEIVAEWRSNEITVSNEHPSDGNAASGVVPAGSDPVGKGEVGSDLIEPLDGDPGPEH